MVKPTLNFRLASNSLFLSCPKPAYNFFGKLCHKIKETSYKQNTSTGLQTNHHYLQHTPDISCMAARNCQQILRLESLKTPLSCVFCSSVSLCRTNQAQIFRFIKCLCTIVLTLPLLIFKSSAIILKDGRRSSASIHHTEHGSSSTPSFPAVKHLNHSKTHILLTVSTCYTCTNISCISVAIFLNLKRKISW